jgi:hypothetical protein
MTPDPQDLLPPRFSAPISARLLRTTPEALAKLRRAGAIHAETRPPRAHYSRAELERVLGRGLTIEEWLRAWKAEKPRRDANRRYNAKRRVADSAKGLRLPAARAAIPQAAEVCQ